MTRLGEHFPAMSDHLGIAVDIDMATLFGGQYSTLSQAQFRKLSIKNRKTRKTYEADILKQWVEHQIYERAMDILRLAVCGEFLERDYVTLNRLDTQITEIFLGAVRRCISTKVPSREPWSPLLKQCGQAIILLEGPFVREDTWHGR